MRQLDKLRQASEAELRGLRQFLAIEDMFGESIPCLMQFQCDTDIYSVMNPIFAGPHLSKSQNNKRVLLDTNIWRYVVDENAQGELFRVSRKGDYQIQAAPAVLFEILRMSDASLRSALVRLITNRRFARPMPEAYSESMEILREVELLRPDWLRANPNTEFFDRLKKDWSRKTGGLWHKYSRFPYKAEPIRQTQDYEMVEGGRRETQNARKQMLNIGWKRNPPMDKTFAGFEEPVSGWRGDMVEAWRIESVVGLTYNLRRTGCAYRDWIAPFVELDNGLLYSAEWVEFWLYQARREALPRQWIRWAHSFAQRFRKTTPGTPGDAQLSTYFLETDIVITADKALIDILEEYRPYAPCALPSGKVVPAGSQGVAQLLTLLN